MRAHNHACCIVFLCVLLPALLAAQAAPPESAGAITVTTHLVEVNVVVTDSKGQPVTNLNQDDFTLLEDGKKQRIASFVLHRRAATTSASSQPFEQLPPGVYTNRMQADTGPLTILLLDVLNTPFLDQAYARNQLLKYLKTQHRPGQKTAIFALTNDLLLLQDFTADTEVLRAALERRGPQESRLLDDPNRDQLVIPNLDPRVAENLERFEKEVAAQRTDIRVQTTLGAMQLLAKAYGGIPGRKNLIWVSAAFPLLLEPEQLTGLSGRWYGDELRRAATLLDKAQIAVYPVDARGLAGSAMSDVRFTGRDIGGHLMSGPRLARELASRANLVTDSHAAMVEIANETGGRAYYNRNDIDRAVALAMEDGSTYYTLAYYPENKNWNGKYRKIKVELSRPGLQARHRHGYLAVDILRGEESRKQAVREINAALVDPILHTMVGFYAAVAPPSNGASPAPPAQPSSPAKQKARVRFKVDPQTITFNSASDGLRQCSLEFVIAALDKSKIIAQEGQTIDGKLTQETYNKLLQQGLIFTTEIELPSAPSHFRLLVRDNHTGLMGTLDVPYTVTAAAK